MTQPSISIHGHRGSRGTHPENTFASFREARDVGASFVELDVHLSKDGHLVVFHDFEITGKLCCDSSGKPVQGSIPLSDLTLNEIQSFDCGSILLSDFPEQKVSPGAKIPTLEELIQWKQKEAPRLKLNIEIKREEKETPWRPSASRLAQSVVELVRKYKLEKDSLVQSFDFEVVDAVRALDPQLRLSCLFERSADFAAEALAHKVQVVAPYFELLDEAAVENCMDAGLEVLPWTVNDVEDWDRLLAMGVRSMITDYPRKLFEYVAITVE